MITPVAAAVSKVSTTPRRSANSSTMAPPSTPNCQPRCSARVSWTAGLHSQGTGRARRRRISWRTPVAIVLIFLGCLLAPVAVLGVWAANQVSDTGRVVANVEPLIHDPAVQNALTDKITNQITSRLNVTGVINQASAQLNSKGLTRISSLLNTFGPQITSSVAGFIH